MSVIPGDRATPPDNAWTIEVCKRGQREACCRFLTMSALGWSCERLTQTGAYLSQRAERGKLTAKGINCTGRASAS